MDYLTHPAITPIIVSLIGALFVGLRWLAERRGWKVEKAIRFVETAVLTVYEDYVRERKLRSEDGKLTEAERVEARKHAVDLAITMAKTEGVDLVKDYGREYLPVLIEKAVNAAKK